MKVVFRVFSVALLILSLGGCFQDDVRIGSKNFTENRIVAEMLRALIDSQGVRTVLVPSFTEPGTALASLRAGTLDVYPDYVAVLLGRMGAPVDLPRDQAHAVVQSALEQVGIAALEPIGFDYAYVAVTTRRIARIEDLKTLEDLRMVSRPLRIGVSDDFARSPDAGLNAALDRLGLQDAEITVVASETRIGLYDELVDGRLDIVVGYLTDPQIRDYKLAVLPSTEGSGVDYDAIALVRRSLIEARPEVEQGLRKIEGRIDTEEMRRLTARVDLDGVPPRTVAREALAEMGLIDAAPRAMAPPLTIAMESPEVGEVAALKTMRGARMTLPGRDIDAVASELPVEDVLAGRARVSLVPGAALFDPGQTPPRLRTGIESIAAPSRSVAHVIVPAGGSKDEEMVRVGTGPEGSPSYVFAQLVQPWLPGSTEIVPLEQADAITAAAALDRGELDAAVLLATLGRSDLEQILVDSDVELADWVGWFQGPARVALPFLHEAAIPDAYYTAEQGEITTVSMQMVVVGPAPRSRTLGRAGPSTYSEDVFPVPDQVIIDLNERLGQTSDVSAQLAPAKILRPQPLALAAPLNPSPGSTILSLVLTAFLLWCAWLFLRAAKSPGDR